MSFTFLDPRQGPASGMVTPAVRLESLTNKRLGLLWNNKMGGDVLLKHVADLLNEKYKLAEVYFTKKTFIGNAAPASVIDDLVSRVDAVIVGVGDWGSCTSGSVLDTINLERRGIPAAVVGQDNLINTTGKGMARAQGYQSMGFATYPFSAKGWSGAASDEEERARAANVVPQVERILFGL